MKLETLTLPLQEGRTAPWPCCTMCRRKAPQGAAPRDPRDAGYGLSPDLSKWGFWEQPMASGFRQKYPICDKCSHGVAQFIATRLERFLQKARTMLKRTHG